MGRKKKSKNSDSEYESEISDKESSNNSSDADDDEDDEDEIIIPKKNKNKEESGSISPIQKPPTETVMDRIYALLIGIKTNQDEYKKTLDNYTKSMNKVNLKMNKLIKLQNALMTTVISSTVSIMSTDTDKKNKYGEIMQNIKTFEDMIDKVRENVERLNKKRDETTADLIGLFEVQDTKPEK